MAAEPNPNPPAAPDLRADEQHLRLALEAGRMGTWSWDPATNRSVWNAREYELLGLTVEHPEGEPTERLFQRIHPDDVAEVTRRVQHAAQHGSDFEMEFRIVLPDGGVRWLAGLGRMDAHAAPGAPRRMFGVNFDITERKHAEAALRESEERFRGYFSLGLIGMAITAPDKGWVEVNDTICGILGYPRAELMRMTWAELTHPDDIAADVAQFDRVVAGACDGYSMAKRFVRRDGRVIHTSLSVQCLRDDTGRVRYFMALVQDVSEQKQLEEQLRQAQKLDAVGQLAGGVAHDFNNLLTVINGYCDLLLTGAGDGSFDALAAIREAGERAAALTRQLLAFSRKSILEAKILNLNDTIRGTANLLRRQVGDHITLQEDLDSELRLIKADPGMMEQVVLNLVLNARDAMPRGGQLTLETRNAELGAGQCQGHPECQPGPCVRLAVRDTGDGMTPAVLARAFEPFFTTKGLGRGTGLGLATVYGVVKQSNGLVEIASEVGKGTTVTVYLPVAEVQQLKPSDPGGPQLPAGTETVLLVEDEPAVRNLARLTLEMHGYAVVDAANGLQALDAVDGKLDAVHLLLTDVVMPGMGGRQLAEQLRQRRPDLKVLFMSGYTDDAVVRHGIQEAADPFLQKPFTAPALLRKVRQVLDGRLTPPASGPSPRTG